VAGYLVNGWNDVVDNNRSKTGGVVVAFKPTAAFAVTQTYLAGKEQAGTANGGVRHLFDSVVSYTVTPKLSLLGNVDYARDRVAGVNVDWYGVAAGLRYQANARWALAPRYEWFSDPQGFTTGLGQRLQEITLTSEYKVVGFVTHLEWRLDLSDNPFFVTTGGAVKRTQSSLTFGFLYALASK
jgi:hypothetical protein